MTEEVNKKNGRGANYTAQENAIICREYPAGTPIPDILDMLRALDIPNRKPWTERTLRHRVGALCVRRPPEYVRANNRANQQRAAFVFCKVPPAPVLLDLPEETLKTSFKPTKDGGVSVALMVAARQFKSCITATCERDAVEAWGIQWAGSKDLRTINAKRQELGLPAFDISGR